MRLTKKSKGVGIDAIRTWATVCLLLGIAGVCIIQNGWLNMANGSGTQLMELLEKDPNMMGYAAVALVCQVIYACAAPLFAFLLVEGNAHTRDFKQYFLRVLGVAAVSELPFNFATTGNLLDTGSRNPAFGLVMALVMLYFFRRYSESGAKSAVIRVVVTVAAMLWTMMLGIQEGPCLVLLTAVLWAFRGKTLWRNIAGCAAAAACCIFSPFYILSPIAVILIHFYNGEEGGESKWVKLLSYPVLLLLFGVLEKIMF